MLKKECWINPFLDVERKPIEGLYHKEFGFPLNSPTKSSIKKEFPELKFRIRRFDINKCNFISSVSTWDTKENLTKIGFTEEEYNWRESLKPSWFEDRFLKDSTRVNTQNNNHKYSLIIRLIEYGKKLEANTIVSAFGFDGVQVYLKCKT